MRLAGSIVLIAGALALAGCGKKAHTPAEHPEATPATLSAETAHEYLEDHPEALVLDVREAAEWNDDVGHIQGAKQIPLRELAGRLSEIADWKDKPILVVCRTGARSQEAADQLRAAGFKLALNLEGGLAAWRSKGY